MTSTIRIATAACLAALVVGQSDAGSAKDGVVGVETFADGWNATEIDILASLRLSQLPPVPQDPSNAFEKNPLAIALGKKLFFDSRFSRNSAVSCASCHDPNRYFQDDRPLAQGIGIATRRTPSIIGAGHSPWLFWDGRKDSLWSQALAPIEDGLEYGGNRTQVAHRVRR